MEIFLSKKGYGICTDLKQTIHSWSIAGLFQDTSSEFQDIFHFEF